MQQALHHEWLGGSNEAKLLVEMLFGELRLYLYQVEMTEIFLCGIYCRLEYQSAIALASLRGDDSADAEVLQLSSARTDAAKRHNLIAVGQP